MARGLRVSARRRSFWTQSGPNTRLAIGALLIATVGLFGLRPVSLFGVLLAWPHAALWGAAGWGRVGLSLRPMLVLIALGMAQDVAFNAPIGSFVMVNLAVYGASAFLSDQLDVEGDPALFWAVPAMLIGLGFLALWVISSSVADHAVRLSPLMLDLAVTLGLFYVLRGLFNLGRRPGEYEGQSA